MKLFFGIFLLLFIACSFLLVVLIVVVYLAFTFILKYSKKMEELLQRKKELVLGGVLAYLFYKFVSLLRTDCDLTLRSTIPTSRKTLIIAKYFENKTVWITGASSGIGKGLAFALCGVPNVRLILSSRRQDALELVKKDLLSINPSLKCEVLALDLKDLNTLEGKTKQAIELFSGGVDVLINNGGVSQRCYALEAGIEVDKEIMDVDYFSAVILSKTLLTQMKNRPESQVIHIVNISSLAGKLGSVLRTAYCGAKFALIGFMDSLRLEHYPRLRVLNVCPGSVSTNVAMNALSKNGEKFNRVDPNIANGMKVERCCELILLGACADLEEIWLFGNFVEKFGAYFSQYLPGVFRRFVKTNAAQVRSKYAGGILGEEEASIGNKKQS